MKKFFLSCLLVTSAFFGLYAAPNEDAQFKQFVETWKTDDTPGAAVVSDPTNRIIFMVLPVEITKAQATPALIKQMRDNLLAGFRDSKDKEGQEYRKIFKKLKISLVFTGVTKDKDIFSFSLSYKDI